MNLKLNFRFIIPLEWTLCELQQAQKHAWRRQLAPTSAWSEPRCRSCHETKISQKWDIPPKSGISHQKWDIPPKVGYPTKSGISHSGPGYLPAWDISLWGGISQKRDISPYCGIYRQVRFPDAGLRADLKNPSTTPYAP